MRLTGDAVREHISDEVRDLRQESLGLKEKVAMEMWGVSISRSIQTRTLVGR